MEKAQERQQRDYASRRETSTSLPPIGTLVWVRNQRTADGGSSKSKKKNIGQNTDWLGPFKLIGYSADFSRAVIEAPGVNGNEGQKWTESWKDVRIKRKKKSASMESADDQPLAKDPKQI